VNLIAHYESGLYKTYMGDSGRIRQILIKFSWECRLNLPNEEVVFRYYLPMAEKVMVKKQVTITVTDTGIGIEADKLELSF